MPSYKGDTGVYEGDILVVDRPFKGRIADLAREICGNPRVIEFYDEDKDLDLARFRLPGLDQVSAHLRDLVDTTPRDDAPQIRPPQGNVSDLDRLLYLLRLNFAARNGGWVPEMGKDRNVETITGLPHLSGGLNGVGLNYPEKPKTITYALPADKQLGKGVRVGVLDTKLFRNPLLAGVPLEIGEDDWLQRGEPYPHWCAHGTFVFGLIAAQAPGATMVYRAVLDDDYARASSWDVARKIVAMRDQRVQILNLSLGTVTKDGLEPLVLARAIRQLGRSCLVVAAAGNHGNPLEHPESENERWPEVTPHSAAYPGADSAVVAVGALEDGRPASFSPKVSWIRLFAEGARQQSTFLTGDVEIRRSAGGEPLVFDTNQPDDAPLKVRFDGLADWSGTSMSSAVVTGRLAALTRVNGGDPFEALGQLIDGPPEGIPSVVQISGPDPVTLAEDSREAEDNWRNLIA